MIENGQVRCAPCGASLHPRYNREALEGSAWATSLPEAEKPTGQEHAGRTARLPEDAVWQVAFDPADMVKARLPEPQFPVVKVTTRRKKRLITAAASCIGMNREADAPSRGRTLASEAKQGNEWGTYIGLERVTTTYHGIAYRPRGPWRRIRHSSRRSNDRTRGAGKLCTGRRAEGD